MMSVLLPVLPWRVLVHLTVAGGVWELVEYVEWEMADHNYKHSRRSQLVVRRTTGISSFWGEVDHAHDLSSDQWVLHCAQQAPRAGEACEMPAHMTTDGRRIQSSIWRWNAIAKQGKRVR